MSRPPVQQWRHPPSTVHHLVSDGESLSVRAVPQYEPEPPSFLHPRRQSSGSTPMTLSQYRPPVHGRPEDGGGPSYSGGPSYGVSPGPGGPLAPYGTQRPSLSGMEYTGPSSPHYDTANYARASISSTGRMTDIDSQPHSSHGSRYSSSPVPSDNGAATYTRSLAPLAQPKPRYSTSSNSPMSLGNLIHHSPTPSPPPRRTSSTPRYHLHIRQQPIAARACGAVDRDRRPVDPPPILQMLITDFDPRSANDLDILQDPRFAVGCLLCPIPSTPESAPGQSTPLLSGKSFVSPFFVDADPDPATAPPTPTTNDIINNHHPATRHAPGEPPSHPATFFIFSDLSVRTAGLYRLQFRLMNWGSVEDTGLSMPILAEAWSDPFRVYPAKDFPGMRDSSALTRGLKEMGFVELKTRGKGTGKGRRK
ncbi:velvet factor family protein [Aspergillus candidus]|uniref:Velvet factor-domain-containing protein n=1 Tax=Aspergillus candidus TaxID=41067 RepID=A0A2I2FB89_ASPCN|nr:velvet factor-domain-containing protein [Aspergillus candidus]PLB37886.1 velvet factor-domain-containing protein [Aspergillus candidus]